MSYQAETAVINSALTDINNMGKVYGLIEPEMFTSEILGAMFFELKKFYEDEEPCDLVIMRSRLTRFDDIHFAQAMQDCISSDTLSTNIKSYALIVLNDYKAKQLDKLLHNTKPDASKIDEQVTHLAETIERIGEIHGGRSETLGDAVDHYARERFTEKREQGIPTGLKSLDEKLQNLDNGDLCIIAARPSVGKSAFSTQIALNIAKAGFKVGMFNLEMENSQVYDRMLAFESGIHLTRIRRAIRYTNDEEQRVTDANNTLKAIGDNLVLVDDLYKVSEIFAFAKKTRLDLVIIDYAQLITPESSYKGNRYAEVGAISHSIKRMAKSLHIPVILLAQLNRRSEMNTTKEPTMAELREAGDFEQDASQIILLWNKSDDRTLKGVKIDKNRQGETGIIEMEFDGRIMRFRDAGEADEEFTPVVNEELPW